MPIVAHDCPLHPLPVCPYPRGRIGEKQAVDAGRVGGGVELPEESSPGMPEQV